MKRADGIVSDDADAGVESGPVLVLLAALREATSSLSKAIAFPSYKQVALRGRVKRGKEVGRLTVMRIQLVETHYHAVHPSPAPCAHALLRQP